MLGNKARVKKVGNLIISSFFPMDVGSLAAKTSHKSVGFGMNNL